VGALWKNGTGCLDQAKLGTYIAHWRARFDLFDDKYPFYQCASMPVSITDSNGNKNPILNPSQILYMNSLQGTMLHCFDHSLDIQPKSVSPSEAARLLVTFQAFAVVGLLTFECCQDLHQKPER